MSFPGSVDFSFTGTLYFLYLIFTLPLDDEGRWSGWSSALLVTPAILVIEGSQLYSLLVTPPPDGEVS